jgi:nickel-dependent lactate racemase
MNIAYGREHVDLEIAPERLISGPSAHETVSESAVAAALESPFHYPALRQALTPDDHIAIVVDEQLPQLAELIAVVLDHLSLAQIAPEAVTLVCPPSTQGQPWLDDLPDAYQEVRVEVHDPVDRNRLSYLATTKHGRRIYLNRTVVDADQTVVLAGCRYDPLVGATEGLTALFPTLSDQATREELFGKPIVKVAGEMSSGLRHEMTEAAWLLGAPFLVQIIEGQCDGIASVIGGSLEAASEARRRLDARWRVVVDRPAHLVLATVTGDPARQDMATLGRALASAARVTEPGGQIVLLTQATPKLGPAFETIRGADSPEEALERLGNQSLPDRVAASQWLQAARTCRIYVLSGLEQEVGEELFVTPLDRADQAQRLINAAASCLVLPDADKALAVVGG